LGESSTFCHRLWTPSRMQPQTSRTIPRLCKPARSDGLTSIYTSCSFRSLNWRAEFEKMLVRLSIDLARCSRS
jgi:hypothetical protein